MIIPIGAQNAYVLNQGIKRNHHLTTATICSLLDVFFISLGIFGGGAILSQNEVLLTSVTLGGIAFLTVYGLMSLKSAFAPAEKKNPPRKLRLAENVLSFWAHWRLLF